jgi:hypothetical protein
MERTISFSVRNFHGTVSMGGIDQTHRSAAKSKTRKCIINSPFDSLASGLATDRAPFRWGQPEKSFFSGKMLASSASLT